MEITKPDKKGIKRAVQILKQGGVIVYPTDTAYALGGIFNSARVSKRILAIKKRKDKKFTIVASSFYQVGRFFKLNSQEKQLAKRFWPGPLSIVVSDRFAIRVPANKTTQKLCQLVGKPLIATSANISGTKTLYQSQKIIEQFKNKKNCPDLIINVGQLKKIKTSTVVKVINNEIKILRPGAIKVKN